MGFPGRLRLLIYMILLMGLIPVQAKQKGAKGRVFLPDGKPAAKAEVSVYYIHDDTGFGTRKMGETYCADDGEFKLQWEATERPSILMGKVPVLRHVVVATKPGYSCSFTEIMPSRRENLRLELDKGRKLSCLVLSWKNEEPVGGVKVRPVGVEDWVPRGRLLQSLTRCPPLELLYRATTGQDGRCVINKVPPGALRVIGEKKGHLAWPASGAREGDGHVTVKMRAFKGHSVDIVATCEGKPVERLVLSNLGGWRRGWHVSDEKGELHFGATRLVMSALRDSSRIPEVVPAIIKFNRRGREDGDVNETININMDAGRLVKLKVVNTRTSQPVGNVLVGVGARVGVFSEGQGKSTRMIFVRRVTDKGGRCFFRLPKRGEQTRVSVLHPPPGYQLKDQFTETVDFSKIGDEFVIELELEKQITDEVAFQLPSGDPAVGADVMLEIEDRRRHFAGQTDSRGAVIVPELTPGTRVLAYVFDSEKNAAGIFDTVLPAQDGKMEVGKLLPAKSGKIVMTNMEAEPVDGRVYGVMSAEGGRQRLRLNSRMLVKKGKGVYEVKGMVPGATYKVTGWVRGYRRGWDGGFKEWKMEGDEKHPKLALKFERGQRRRSSTNPVNSKADFIKKLKALNSAEWKKQDPYAH
ncbi:MAG: hypothetical protein KGZ25_03240, partial [Planctomycetes bacterium]|nr:hypothetical protein [Planctomycetota bacterium]